MCEILEVRFSRRRCRNRCADEALTPLVLRCAAALQGHRCRSTRTAIEVPIYCSRHRKKAIEESVENYYRFLKKCKVEHPQTKATVKKQELLHEEVKERTLLYPELLEKEYNKNHEEAIRSFRRHYVSTRSLGFPTGTTRNDYEFLNQFQDKLNLAMREYKYFVELFEPPTEQPDTVRAVFWEYDDPVLELLEV